MSGKIEITATRLALYVTDRGPGAYDLIEDIATDPLLADLPEVKEANYAVVNALRAVICKCEGRIAREIERQEVAKWLSILESVIVLAMHEEKEAARKVGLESLRLKMTQQSVSTYIPQFNYPLYIK